MFVEAGSNLATAGAHLAITNAHLAVQNTNTVIDLGNTALDLGWKMAGVIFFPAAKKVVQPPPPPLPELVNDFKIPGVNVTGIRISPFAALWKFQTTDSCPDQNLLYCGSMSGWSAAAILSDIVPKLMPHFQVYVLAPIDPRNVPVAYGDYDLGYATGDIVSATKFVHNGILVGHSEAGHRALVATAYMSKHRDKYGSRVPAGLIVKGSPIHPAADHSDLTRLAATGWGAELLFETVQAPHLGAGRRILPPEAQIDKRGMCCPVPTQVGPPRQAMPAVQIRQRLWWVFEYNRLMQGEYVLRHGDIRELIDPSKITCPVKVFVGMEDRTVRSGQTRAVQKLISKAEVVEVNCDHWGHVTGPSMENHVVPEMVEFGLRVRESNRLVAA
jgi:poly-beta-hydroxyalkanoate depolymerase